MSSSRRSSTMFAPRTSASVEAQRQPRRLPRTLPETTSTYIPQMVTQSGFALVSGPSDMFPQVATCWPTFNDNFNPSNDGDYIPTSSVAPTDLNSGFFWDNAIAFDVDTLSNSSSSGSSSSGTSKTSISPPLSEAEMAQVDMYTASSYHTGTNQFPLYADQWVHPMLMPPTPPSDSILDNLELFTKPDALAFTSLPEAAAAECEYLGKSRLQFSSAPTRHHQPRPIRSASERSPVESRSGSPKDEPAERVKNNPRNDPRYEVRADRDGFYHCPYATTENCNHKPTKQKCIYAKNLDSHLKPYICKYGSVDENCRSLRFSSNACLFRHEREMHGMHNHGINPYLCRFSGCERARSDNGFPRRWNQRDHMKRVHGWEEPDHDDTAARGYADSSRRRKVPGASNSVPMKRAGSARAQASFYQGQARNLNDPRYTAQMHKELQAQNIMVPGMTVDTVNYTTQPMVTHSYGPGVYMQSAY